MTLPFFVDRLECLQRLQENPAWNSTGPTGRDGWGSRSQGFTLYPTDKDLSAGTPAWAILDRSSGAEDRRVCRFNLPGNDGRYGFDSAQVIAPASSRVHVQRFADGPQLLHHGLAGKTIR